MESKDGYLDVFLGIDWKKPEDDDLRREFCVDYEAAEAQSHTFQLIHDQLIDYPLYIEEDQEDGTQTPKKNCTRHCPGYSVSLRLPNSVFSTNEMNKIFTYFLNIRKGRILLSQLPEKERNNYQLCFDAVSDEQAKYLSLAQDMWTRFNYNRVFHVRNSVETYMKELWLKKVEAVQQLYPKAYRQINSLNFVGGSVDTDNPVYLGQGVLLKKQSYSKVIRVPKNWTHVSIPVCNEDLVSRKDPVWSLVKKPVSSDEAAMEWAREYKPDVVLTASALKTLANNIPQHYMAEWNLMVTIKDVACAGGGKKKVVFIDKPLPPNSVTHTRQAEWHAKLACKMLLSSRTKKKKKSDERSGGSRNLSVYEDDEYWLSCDSDIESFGICSEPKAETETVTSDNLQMDDAVSPETSSQEEKKKKEFHLYDYSYRLWKLCTASDKLQEKQKILRKGDKLNIKPLSIIVRNKMDGSVIHDSNLSDAVISSKVEYQADLGAEAMCLTGLVNEWLDLLIRPDSRLVRVRVSYEGEYIMTERKQINDVEAEASRLYQFNVKSTLKTVQVLLCQLCDMKPGQYLVMHTSNHGAFAHVYNAVPPTTQHVFDLHEFCKRNWSKGITTEQHAPWKLLDVTVFTPLHYYTKRVPGTFKPGFSCTRSAVAKHTQRLEIKKACIKIRKSIKAKKRSMQNRRRKLNRKRKKEEEDKMESSSTERLTT